MLVSALALADCQITNHILRVTDIPNLAADLDFSNSKTIGLIINTQARSMGIFSSRHWLAVPKIGLKYFNCDSKLPEPEPFESIEALLSFLTTLVEENEGNIFVIQTSKAE